MDDYKVATAATNWWIHQMKLQCKKLYPDKVAGDDFNIVIVDNCLKGELARFQNVLSKAIQNYLLQRTYVSLSCYYIPNRDLSKIASAAGISKTYFPTRAAMQICCGSVEVSLNGEDLHKLPIPAK